MLGRTSPEAAAKSPTRDIPRQRGPGVQTFWADEGAVIPFSHISAVYPRSTGYEDEAPILVIQVDTGTEFTVEAPERAAAFLDLYVAYLSVVGRSFYRAKE